MQLEPLAPCRVSLAFVPTFASTFTLVASASAACFSRSLVGSPLPSPTDDETSRLVRLFNNATCRRRTVAPAGRPTNSLARVSRAGRMGENSESGRESRRRSLFDLAAALASNRRAQTWRRPDSNRSSARPQVSLNQQPGVIYAARSSHWPRRSQSGTPICPSPRYFGTLTETSRRRRRRPAAWPLDASPGRST